MDLLWKFSNMLLLAFLAVYGAAALAAPKLVVSSESNDATAVQAQPRYAGGLRVEARGPALQGKEIAT